MTTAAAFPIALDSFKKLPLDPSSATLTDDQRADLNHNIQLCRDAIVFFTAIGDAKGLGGHTGGPYDTVPEVMIAYSFMQGPAKDTIVPIFFDEAGHRVATQYLLSVLDGDMPVDKLLHYREYLSHLPGHPERDFTPGVKFSSGRLGHMWPFVNGVALAHPDQHVLMLGSDGSQMEGNDAEAARLCVSENLNVKLLIDDNDVTIAGHPSNYMKGFSVAQTLEGHGLKVDVGQGEDLDSLYARMCQAFTTDGPVALINKRKMAPGINHLEGSTHGHDVIKTSYAIEYLESRNLQDAADYLSNVEKGPSAPAYTGSTGSGKNRSLFGKVFNDIVGEMSQADRINSVKVFDNDLEGSCGLDVIRDKFPEIFVRGGIMERGNFSAAAGFGMHEGRQGVFATFSAFLEMCVSEITMARLNKSNVLAHFSHAGCDDMADNTCHFGVNNLFADNGLPGAPAGPDGEEADDADDTRLFFPADQHQFEKCLRTIYPLGGLRFLFSTRSAVPDILKEDSDQRFFGDGYTFEVGRDDVLRTGKDGFIVSFGETLYRAWDAVLTMKSAGLDVGLICKTTLNQADEAVMNQLAAAPAVLVAESFNVKTGLGSRFGSALLKRGFAGRYDHLGTHKEGSGGLWRQMGHQGLDPEGIEKTFRKLVGK